MASVGASGCGFEHQLESVYAALAQHEGERRLSARATLSRGGLRHQRGRRLGATDGEVLREQQRRDGDERDWPVRELSPDALRRPVRRHADPHGMPVGPLADCTPMPNPTGDPSLAYDVQRYIDFFTRPAVQGGAKIDPNDVVLVGLDGPETPFSTFLFDTTTGNTPYHACATPTLSSRCVEALQHSCENAVQPEFFADPAVRLATVIGKAAHHVTASICGDDLTKAPDFSATMAEVGKLLIGFLQPGLPQRADCCARRRRDARLRGRRRDRVRRWTRRYRRGLGSCARNGNVTPCWRYNDLLAQYQMQGCVPPPGPPPPSCKLPPSGQPVVNPLDNTMQLASISVDRGGAPAPDNTTTHARDDDSCRARSSTRRRVRNG